MNAAVGTRNVSSVCWFFKSQCVTVTSVRINSGYIVVFVYLAMIIQQDETIYSVFISVNCSTCFRWYLHPSSGVHITVSTVSLIPDTVDTVI